MLLELLNREVPEPFVDHCVALREVCTRRGLCPSSAFTAALPLPDVAVPCSGVAWRGVACVRAALCEHGVWQTFFPTCAGEGGCVAETRPRHCVCATW